jgi:uncharacterized tellurite resistance protein B-like protein
MLAFMFERLIKSLGQPANSQNGDEAHDPEMQLATAQLLYGVLPADYHVEQLECIALMRSFERLFGIGPARRHKLVARAAAAFDKDPGILACATLLKRQTSIAYRRQIVAEARTIASSDGDVHLNETDLIARLESMLGLKGETLKRSA